MKGASDAGSDAADGPDTTAVFLASGFVVELSDGTPIAGAQVCIVDYPMIPCSFTDPTGKYTLTFPPLSSPLDIAFNLSAPGHLGVTEIYHESLAGLAWPGRVPLRDDAAAATLLTQAGFTYPAPDTGFIEFSVRVGDGGYADATAVVSPTSGTGPVYLDATGTPDPTLTAVGSNSGALFGNLAPGKVEITVSPQCDVSRSDRFWTETKPGTVAGQVVAGSMTHMVMLCM